MTTANYNYIPALFALCALLYGCGDGKTSCACDGGMDASDTLDRATASNGEDTETDSVPPKTDDTDMETDTPSDTRADSDAPGTDSDSGDTGTVLIDGGNPPDTGELDAGDDGGEAPTDSDAVSSDEPDSATESDPGDSDVADAGGPTDTGSGIPPTVVSTTPGDGDEDVAITAPIWVEFSALMDPVTTEAAFSLSADDTSVTGTFTWAAENMVFSPDEDLAPGTPYTIRLSTDATDTYGLPLETALTVRFTTGVDVNVRSVIPADGADDIAIDATIVVEFGQEMDAPSVETEFELVNESGDAVEGTFGWTEHTLTFVPDTALLNVETYTIAIGRGATDTAGNHLADAFSTTFTTAATPPTLSGDDFSDAPIWTWTGPADVTGYRYQLDTEDGDWTEVDASETSYQDSGLSEGGHTLYLQAQYGDVWSASSSWTSEVGPVCEGDLIINSADDLLGITCARVTGNLQVLATILTDLAGLESIRTIDGNLDLQYNLNLTSLIGLENLTVIGGHLMSFNDGLVTLDGLISLERIDGGISLNDASLSSLSGPSALESIGGSFVISRSTVTSTAGLDSLAAIGEDLYVNRSQVTDLSGLPLLETIGGTLNVFRSNLTSFGLTDLVAIGGDLNIEESDVSSFAGLENLETITGSLSFYDAYATTDLTGLGGLKTLGGNLSILNSSAPASLVGLDTLETIQGDISIRLANGLTGFGMPLLSTVEGSVSVEESHYLLSFDGLPGLATIGGDLTIRSHMGLSSVTGMTSLSSLGGSLAIQNNMVLPTCDALLLEDQLRDAGWEGTASIAANDDTGTCN